jgi:hypothetical protein
VFVPQKRSCRREIRFATVGMPFRPREDASSNSRRSLGRRRSIPAWQGRSRSASMVVRPESARLRPAGVQSAVLSIGLELARPYSRHRERPLADISGFETGAEDLAGRLERSHIADGDSVAVAVEWPRREDLIVRGA